MVNGSAPNSARPEINSARGPASDTVMANQQTLAPGTSLGVGVPLQDDEVEKRYKFGRTLGQGTFATVKLAVCLEDRTRWAVKVIKRSALTSQDEESLRMEIQILQLTNHPNIVSVKEVFYCRNYVYLVMDLMTGGELFDRIVMKDHYSEQEAKTALAQIVVAIQYCHEKNIVHRDLKPENILYASPEENAQLKLADFGLATMLKSNQLMTVACGTPGYVAPEILRGVAYGKEVDIWSIGVILYILLCGFPPFYDDNNKKLFAQIVAANYSFPEPYWTNISPQAKDLIRRLLVVDPKARLTAEEILSHPWMTEDGSGYSLSHFRPNLKSYNARRRFRAAIRAVQLTQLLKKMASNRSNGNGSQSENVGQSVSDGAVKVSGASGGGGTNLVAVLENSSPQDTPLLIHNSVGDDRSVAPSSGAGSDGEESDADEVSRGPRAALGINLGSNPEVDPAAVKLAGIPEGTEHSASTGNVQTVAAPTVAATSTATPSTIPPNGITITATSSTAIPIPSIKMRTTPGVAVPSNVRISSH